MKLLRSLLVLVAGALCSALHAEPLVISSDTTGLITESISAAKPDSDGLVLTREVKLPAFERGAYYRPFSAPGKGGSARGNRVEAVAFKSIADLQAYQPSETRKGHTNVQQGQFILLELKDGDYLAVLPMTSEKVYGQFFVEDGRLLLKTGNYGTDTVEGEIPLVAWSYGKSPYAATQSVWGQLFQSGYVAAQPRSGKQFPEEPYGYLGWCSWEFYKRNISEEVITDAFHTLEESGAPIRWVMVDDGYLDVAGGKLLSFGVDKNKFPNGWEPIIDLKDPERIKWLGIWRNFGGYMGGISTQHTMEDLESSLLVHPVDKTRVLPNGSDEGAKAFYDTMVSDTKDNGFDFVKVDFHTRTFDHYEGTADAVGAMRANNEALENATHEMGIPLLNCIAQPNVNSLQTKYSSLTRSSPDYNQTDKDKNKCNTYQSFANHLWMGQSVWGDLDMFHTHDERDVRSMSIARAISGGPVYISDEPSKVVPEVLTQFCYLDGKLLRTAAPATLLPESFFIHPFRDGKPFRVVAPLEDRVAAIALFNFTEGGKSLPVGISVEDYPFAGELLQPSEAWRQPEEGLLVYDRDLKKVIPLDRELSTTVANFDAKLLLLYPKTKGWAVIGRSDKYLPSAAVKIDSVSDQKVTFTLKESGPLMVWSEKGAPQMKGVSFEALGDGLYFADLPEVSGMIKVTLRR